ncbi:uncharacterized protein LOC144102625 [Amblyomma americanum]
MQLAKKYIKTMQGISVFKTHLEFAKNAKKPRLHPRAYDYDAWSPHRKDEASSNKAEQHLGAVTKSSCCVENGEKLIRRVEQPISVLAAGELKEWLVANLLRTQNGVLAMPTLHSGKHVDYHHLNSACNSDVESTPQDTVSHNAALDCAGSSSWNLDSAPHHHADEHAPDGIPIIRTRTPMGASGFLSSQQALAVGGFNHHIMKLLLEIRSDIKELKGNYSATLDMETGSDTVMVATSLEKLADIEEVLADKDQRALLIRKLALIGGETTDETTKLIMKTLVKTPVALRYTLEGRGEKQSFKNLRLYSAIVAAVQRRIPTATIEGINNRVAAFLRGARDRDGGRRARMKGVDSSPQ